MRKFWQVVGIAALAILVAVPAMALDFKFGGSYRVRFYSFDGIGAEGATVGAGPFVKSKPNARNQADLRFRPMFTVEDDNKNIQSVLRFEIGDVVFGDNANAAAGTITTAGRSVGGATASDGVSLETKWAFIDFQIPFGVPARLRAGLQGYYLPKGMILDDDAAGISIYGKAGMLGYNAFWFAINDSSNAGTDTTGGATVGPFNDDVDMYGAKLDFNLSKAFMPYVYGLYRHGSVVNAVVGTVPDMTSSDGYWIGVGAVGNLGFMKYDVDFIYATDEPRLDSGVIVVGGLNKQKGWMADGGVEFPVGPVNIGLRGMYATGDNADTADVNEDFPTLPGTAAGNSMASYVPKGAEIFWSSHGSTYMQGGYQNGGWNSWAFGGYVEYYPVKALMTRLTYYYVGAPKSNTNFYTGKSSLGHEINLLAEYKIYTGAKIWGLAGVFLTPSQGQEPATGATVELKDAMVFSVGVQHDF